MTKKLKSLLKWYHTKKWEMDFLGRKDGMFFVFFSYCAFWNFHFHKYCSFLNRKFMGYTSTKSYEIKMHCSINFVENYILCGKCPFQIICNISQIQSLTAAWDALKKYGIDYIDPHKKTSCSSVWYSCLQTQQVWKNEWWEDKRCFQPKPQIMWLPELSLFHISYSLFTSEAAGFNASVCEASQS